MKQSIPNIYLLLVLSLFLFEANAHEQETLFNTVNLEAVAEREIPNDEMTAVLAAEHEGSKPSALAERINSDMQKALDIIETYEDVNSRTQNYQTYPVYDKQVIAGWRGSQLIELRSTNIPALTDLVGKLQKVLQVRQMNFNPTDVTRKQYENDLIEEAMQAFKQRVDVIGKHMDKKNNRIVSININTSGQRPPILYQHSQARAQAESAAPAVEAGTSKLTVTVSGTVQFF